MRPQSAKAKGRNLCKVVKQLMLSIFTQLEDEDIKVTSSGAGGEDLQFSPAARRLMPISVECKNQEKVNIWASYNQAAANAGKHEPVLIIKKNHTKPLAVVDVDFFLRMFNGK